MVKYATRVRWLFFVLCFFWTCIYSSSASAGWLDSPIGDPIPDRWSNLETAREREIRIAPGHPDANDPYAPAAVMLEGPYAGQWIDTSVRRPVLQRNSPSPGILRVANIFYQGRFWIADIRLADVADVFLQRHSFGWPFSLTHEDHLVQMREGTTIELISQRRLEPTIRAQIPALEISAEATGPRGVGFAGARDLLPRAAIVIRVSGLSERAPVKPFTSKFSETDPRNPFVRFQYRINDVGGAGQFLERALNLSERWGFHYMFNLACRNCHTAADEIEQIGFAGLSNYREPSLISRWVMNKLPQTIASRLKSRGLYQPPDNPIQPMETTKAILPNPTSGGPSSASLLERTCNLAVGGRGGRSYARASTAPGVADGLIGRGGGVTIPPSLPR